jgi:demethylmenaquinone methyltransferase/2-methoxy-6-polyprenyl-1,4-benzoquinol methylase
MQETLNSFLYKRVILANMTNNVLFNLVAPIYDHVINFNSAEKLADLLRLDGSQTLLDLGGGTGRITAALTPHAARTYIADLSMPMLRQAQSKAIAHLINTSSNHLPFADGMLDAIVVVDALHHFSHQQQVIAELFRILKPGGRLVIEEPNIHQFSVKLIALAEKLALMGSHFHTPEQIHAMVTPFDNVSANIVHSDNHAVWVVAEKSSPDSRQIAAQRGITA